MPQRKITKKGSTERHPVAPQDELTATPNPNKTKLQWGLQLAHAIFSGCF